MRSYLKHPLARPLSTRELWLDPITEHSCTAMVKGRPCKNSATHMTVNEEHEDVAKVCFIHAVVWVEARTSEPVLADQVEKCEHNWRVCCVRHRHHVTFHRNCTLR